MLPKRTPAPGTTVRRPPKKVMRTYRLPPALAAFLDAEAARRGIDGTAFVIRVLDGFRTDYGLPAAARAVLDEDRRTQGLEQERYLLHALYCRHLELHDRGAGSVAPKARSPVKVVEGGR